MENKLLKRIRLNFGMSQKYIDMLDTICEDNQFNRQEAFKYLITKEFSKTEGEK